MGGGLRTLDPHHAVSVAEHAAVNALHLGLTQYDQSGALVPGLAEYWTLSEDGRTYTFVLKSGLTWSNGDPLVPEDVVAGFRRALNQENPSPFAAKLYPIVNAEAYRNGSMDTRQALGVAVAESGNVVVSLARRDFGFLNVLAHPVAKPAPFRQPDRVADSKVSSGVFRLSRRDETGVVLENGSTRMTLYLREAESVQQMWAESVRVENFVTAAFPIIAVPQNSTRRSNVRFDGGDSLYGYAVNTTKAPLNTLEARHALAMAINRPELINRSQISDARPATQFVPPSAMTYEQPYRTPFAGLTFEEREAVAAALLSEQGYGVENRFTVKLRIPDGDVHADIASTVAGMWAKSGIDTEIVVAPLPEHWDALTRGDFDVAFASWPGPRNAPRPSLEPLSQAGGPWNWSRYAFPEFDSRLKRASQSQKADVRANQYREAEKALIEDQSLLALFFYRPLALVSQNVYGWQENDVGIHPLSSLSVSQESIKPDPS